MIKGQAGEERIDIRRYLGIVVQHRFLALFLFLTVLSVITWGSFLKENVYEAKSLVLIERSEVLAPLLKGMAVDFRAETLIRTIKKNMLSRSIIDKVIKKLNLDAEVENDTQYERLLEAVKDKVSVRVQGTDLFELSYTGRNPEMVRDFVNAIVNTYIETNVGSTMGETYKAIDFIEEQIMFYKKKLDESDRKLREFKERNPGIFTVDEGALLRRVEGLNSRLAEAELALKEHVREKENLESQIKGEEPLAVTLMKNESSPERWLNQARGRLDMLRAQYTDMHPEVKKLKNEIAKVERSFKGTDFQRNGQMEDQEIGINPIYQQLKERLSRTKTDIELTTTKVTELKRMVEKSQTNLDSRPKEQEELTRLTRGRDVYQNMYDTFMAKLENARLSKALEEADKGESFRVMDPAMLPVSPIKPNRVKLILLGFLLAIGAAIGGPIGLDMLNPAFRDVKSVEDAFGVRVIGVVPGMQLEPEYVIKRKRWLVYSSLTGIYLIAIAVVLVREFIFQSTGKLILF